MRNRSPRPAKGPIAVGKEKLAGARRASDSMGRLKAQLEVAIARHESARKSLLAATAECENAYAEVSLWSERIELAKQKKKPTA
jgi:hypothetical protein